MTSDTDTHWSRMSDEELWDHVSSLDSTLFVGLKHPGQPRGVDALGQRLVPLSDVPGMEAAVLRPGVELVSRDDVHPLLTVRVEGAEAIHRLRRSPFIEFVEPASFDYTDVQPYSKCGPSEVYAEGGTTPEGDQIPYSAEWHNVDKAWGLAAGEGIEVGVIDTGTSRYHHQLLTEWDDWKSAGRTLRRSYTDGNTDHYPVLWHDSCGHGSKVLGLIGAPRDGRSVVGFAYRADAHAIRALDDPVALQGVWGEIIEAIDLAAPTARVINNSWGSPFTITAVENRIRYWYNNEDLEFGPMFIAAVGSATDSETSAFPAGMPEVVAITGINPATSSHPNYYPCAACFRGDDVEFSSWVNPRTTGTDRNSTTGLGRSSVASAAISGIAAVVWSRYPTWTREQVLDRLRRASPLYYKRNGSGYGPPDAFKAVGGTYGAGVTEYTETEVELGQEVESRYLRAAPFSLDPYAEGRYRFRWSDGRTTRDVGIPTCGTSASVRTISVTITDLLDGTVVVGRETYSVPECPPSGPTKQLPGDSGPDGA